MAESDTARVGWDFFVSYTQADLAWAEWIAWVLEEDGYRVLVQAWDFVPGGNWVQAMHAGARDAERTIAVLSARYLGSVYGTAEWQAAWAADPAGAGRRLLVVRVADCGRPGLLAGVTGVDVFGLGQAEAATRLREMVSGAVAGRAKPLAPAWFPWPGGAGGAAVPWVVAGGVEGAGPESALHRTGQGAGGAGAGAGGRACGDGAVGARDGRGGQVRAGGRVRPRPCRGL